jgi:peptidoglycan/LPS O-acetylase OafA/YrhL
VVWFHTTAKWDRPLDPFFGWFHDLARIGWVGVDIFFVISGYCVAERAARSLRTREGAGPFILDRARRIYPAYWATLLLAMILATAATPFNGLPLASALPPNLLFTLIDAALLAPCLDTPAYLLVSWTLTCEMAFYALIALGLALMPFVRNATALVITGFAFAASQAVGWIDLPGRTLDLWPEFFCGLLVWQALRWERSAKSLTAIAGIVILGLLGCIHFSPTNMLPWAACFSLLLLVLKKFDDVLARTRAFAFLGWVGVFSYSLYLIHVPFISPGMNLLHRLMPDSAPHQAWIPVALTALSLIPAWLFYRWVETPFEQWRRRRARRALDSAATVHPVV